MRKIEHYVGKHDPNTPSPLQSDSFLFHKDVLAAKNARSIDLVNRINGLNADIEPRFDEYDRAFANDCLEGISENARMKANADDLKSLYKYNAKPFQGLYEFLVKKNGVLCDTCPNCELDSITSFDHQLPQSKYPEFSDHPLNLMPCCQGCNGHKSANWVSNGSRTYLNLYIDDVPDVQYLFVNLTLCGNTIECNFVVENRSGIDAGMFSKIENHYKDLLLCTRYRKKANMVIEDVRNVLTIGKRNVSAGKMSKEDVRQDILETVRLLKQRFGCNYWKVLIQEACCNDPVIFDYLYNNA